MNIVSHATAGVAVLSFFVSIFVLLRDRRSRRIDLLYRCYERVMNRYSERVPLTDDERSALQSEDADESLKAKKERHDDVHFETERELDATCYLLLKRQFSKRTVWLRSSVYRCHA